MLSQEKMGLLRSVWPFLLLVALGFFAVGYFFAVSFGHESNRCYSLVGMKDNVSRRSSSTVARGDRGSTSRCSETTGRPLITMSGIRSSSWRAHPSMTPSFCTHASSLWLSMSDPGLRPPEQKCAFLSLVSN